MRHWRPIFLPFNFPLYRCLLTVLKEILRKLATCSGDSIGSNSSHIVCLSLVIVKNDLTPYEIPYFTKTSRNTLIRYKQIIAYHTNPIDIIKYHYISQCINFKIDYANCLLQKAVLSCIIVSEHIIAYHAQPTKSPPLLA